MTTEIVLTYSEIICTMDLDTNLYIEIQFGWTSRFTKYLM